MPNKKHYWTQVFIVTTGLSCGIGFVCGFGAASYYGWSSAQCHHQSNAGYEELERALELCATPAFVQIPVIHPCAVFLDPFDANRISSPPYSGMAVQGKYLTMEGVPEAGGKREYPRIHKSTHCGLDATPIAIGLPLGIFALLLAFRKKLF